MSIRDQSRTGYSITVSIEAVNKQGYCGTPVQGPRAVVPTIGEWPLSASPGWLSADSGIEVGEV